MSQVSAIKDRAIIMLGGGAPASIVAQALGVTESAISQMLADEEFAKEVAELRFKNLSRQTALDDKYTSLEEKLVAKVEKLLPLMTKPRDVVDTLRTINATKRRGSQAIDTATQSSKIVSLTIPVTIAHKFISNVNNQVIEVHDDTGTASSLVTVASSSLDKLARASAATKAQVQESITYDSPQALLLGSDSETLQEGLAKSRHSADRDAGATSLADFL